MRPWRINARRCDLAYRAMARAAYSLKCSGQKPTWRATSARNLTTTAMTPVAPQFGLPGDLRPCLLCSLLWLTCRLFLANPEATR